MQGHETVRLHRGAPQAGSSSVELPEKHLLRRKSGGCAAQAPATLPCSCFSPALPTAKMRAVVDMRHDEFTDTQQTSVSHSAPLIAGQEHGDVLRSDRLHVTEAWAFGSPERAPASSMSMSAKLVWRTLRGSRFKLDSRWHVCSLWHHEGGLQVLRQGEEAETICEAVSTVCEGQTQAGVHRYARYCNKSRHAAHHCLPRRGAAPTTVPLPVHHLLHVRDLSQRPLALGHT